MTNVRFMAHRALDMKDKLRWGLIRAARHVDPDVSVARNWAEEGAFFFRFSDGSVIRTADWHIVLPEGYESVRVELKSKLGVFTPGL